MANCVRCGGRIDRSYANIDRADPSFNFDAIKAEMGKRMQEAEAASHSPSS